MSREVRFALFADPVAARPAFDEMAAAILGNAALTLEPIFVSSYAGLAQAVENGACDAVWAPPIVAQGLVAAATGKPLVTVGRRGRTSYFSVLLARAGTGVDGPRALKGVHIGWVSKLSAAGYIVPALYLRSLGIEPDETFAQQSFLGSHDAVVRALAAETLDVVATYATIAPSGRTLDFPASVPSSARVIVVAGPIPGDAIFAAAELSARVREALVGGFLATKVRPGGALSRLMNVDRFEVPSLDHFQTLRRWQARAIESEPRLRVAR